MMQLMEGQLRATFGFIFKQHMSITKDLCYGHVKKNKLHRVTVVMLLGG